MLDSWHISNDLRDPGCAHVITRVGETRDMSINSRRGFVFIYGGMAQVVELLVLSSQRTRVRFPVFPTNLGLYGSFFMGIS